MTLNDNNEYVFRYWIVAVYETPAYTGQQAIRVKTIYNQISRQEKFKKNSKTMMM